MFVRPVRPSLSLPSSQEVTTAFADKDQRLVLGQIEIENFKSYGGLVRVGPFHSRFTSIIGPNGSGKSNIIDALLFVFGRRANQLRQKNLHSLIHRSAQLRPTKARVACFFLFDDGQQMLPAFSVGREVSSDGSSKYLLNDKPVNVKDVTTFLKSHGIDLEHNRFLILQGEVEHLSMMPPKGKSKDETGLLEFMEDLIGTSELQEPLQHAHDIHLEQQRQFEAQMRIVDLAKRDLAAMAGPCQSALTLIRQQKRKLLLEAQSMRVSIKEIQIQEQLHLHEMGKAQEALALWKEERQGGQTQLEELQNELNVLDKTLLKLHNLEKKQTLEIEKAERDDKRLRARAGSQEESLQRLRNQIRSLEHSEFALKQEIDDFDAKVLTAKKTLPTMKAELETIRAEAARHENAWDEEMRRLRAVRDKVETQMKTKKTNAEAADAAAAVAEREEQMLGQGFTKVSEQMKTVEENILKVEREITGLLERREFVNSEIAKFKKEDDRMRELQLKWVHEVEQIENQIPAIQTKIAESSGATCSSQHYKQLQAIRELGRTVDGIRGSLWDMVAPKNAEKYGLALAAAGATSELCVVDSVKAASEAIEYFRTKGLGRVANAVLPTLSTSQAKIMQQFKSQIAQKKIPKGALPILSLFENVDPEIECVLIFAIRDTLVVEEGGLEKAKAVALSNGQRWRVVTLKGEVVEKSGVITGGRITNFLATRKKVPDAQSQQSTKRLEAELIALRQKKDNLNSELAKSKKDLESVRADLADRENEAQSLGPQISRREKMLAESQNVISQKRQQLANFSSEDRMEWKRKAAEAQKLRSLAQQKRQAAEAEDANFKRAVANFDKVGGEQKKQMDRRREELEKGIEENGVLIRDAKIQKLAKIQEVEEMSQRKLPDLQKALETLEKEREATLEEQKKLEESAMSCVETLEGVKRHLVNQNEKRRLLQEAMEDLRKELRMQDLEESSHVAKIGESEHGAHECQIQIRKTEKAIADLKETFEGFGDIEEFTEADLRIIWDIDAYTDLNTLTMDLHEITRQINNQEITDVTIVEKFRQKNAQLKEMEIVAEQLEIRRDGSREHWEKLKNERLEIFTKGFKTLSFKVKELYQMLTLGGDAELESIDPSSPFSEGIAFSVRPPKKSWRPIQHLSGGEKTLASLALIFALHHYKPTPVYFLDEIDAALDAANICIIASYIASQCFNAQFIVVSLRYQLFERASRLVGVYKANDVTNVCCLDPADFSTGDETDDEENISNEIELFS